MNNGVGVVGEQNPKSSPKDVFYHVLLIVTLYMSVVSFIVLLFQYVNILLPDPLDQSGYALRAAFDGIRWGSSVLLVAFPVFLLMSWLLEREFRAQPAKHELKVRKWLVYLTLFIAAITIIVDLMILIYNFYGGDLTGRFALQILVVLTVAAAVFGYYIWDLRRQQIDSTVPKRFAWGTSAVVVVAIVTGFLVGGSPAHQRQLRFDEQRIHDLQSIQSQVVFFWSQKERLPEQLSELQDSISGFSVPRDPETGQAYEYSVTNDLSFELCAIFATKGGFDGRLPAPARPAYDGPVAIDAYEDNWQHEAGRTCFERTIDPELHRQQR